MAPVHDADLAILLGEVHIAAPLGLLETLLGDFLDVPDGQNALAINALALDEQLHAVRDGHGESPAEHGHANLGILCDRAQGNQVVAELAGRPDGKQIADVLALRCAQVEQLLELGVEREHALVDALGQAIQGGQGLVPSAAEARHEALVAEMDLVMHQPLHHRQHEGEDVLVGARSQRCAHPKNGLHLPHAHRGRRAQRCGERAAVVAVGLLVGRPHDGILVAARQRRAIACLFLEYKLGDVACGVLHAKLRNLRRRQSFCLLIRFLAREQQRCDRLPQSLT
mmetsp:Transcript_104549/g.300951  ORF Transcript_104549/g.300951 Transcript_104549/m.300951 type:complete len:283 (-) Transcript_104549:129-977(-)